MYRLGRQIRIDNIVPIAIFDGAINNCAPPEKLPTTTPYAIMPSNTRDRSHRSNADRQLFCNSWMIRPGYLSNASMTSGGDAPSGIGSNANRPGIGGGWDD